MRLRGITVELEVLTPDGKDEANRQQYTSEFVAVENVLVGIPKEQEILDTLNLSGRKAVYTLGIPKGDTHNWTDKKVRFWGQTYRTIGHPVTGIPELIPLDWGQNVRVEIYE